MFRPWLVRGAALTAGALFAGVLFLVVRAKVDDTIARSTRTEGGFSPREMYLASPPPLIRLARAAGIQHEPAAAIVSLDASSSGTQVEAEEESVPTFQSAPRKLVRKAWLTLEVRDFAAASHDLARMAGASGGYVGNTDVQRHPAGHRSGTLVLRIPADQLEATGSAVRRLGQVLSEKSEVEDVSKACGELETRLKVKREAESRVRDLLRQRTGSLKEVLEAEKELARIHTEIEILEGEQRHLDHQVRLTTLTVALQEPEPLGLARPSAWASLGDAVRDSGALLSGSLAALLQLLIVLVPWAVLGWPASRLWRRWRRRARTEPAA